jgi:hypothetical protein
VPVMRLLYAFPATCALIYRAKSRNSLTPAGIFAATLTAVAHAYHPWNLPFALLCVFFLAGTRVTHVSICARYPRSLFSRRFRSKKGSSPTIPSALRAPLEEKGLEHTFKVGKHLKLCECSHLANICSSSRQQLDGLGPFPTARKPITQTRNRTCRPQYPGSYGITMLLLGR